MEKNKKAEKGALRIASLKTFIAGDVNKTKNGC